MTELNLVNPDGAPVNVATPVGKARRTLKQAKGKMTLSEAAPVLREDGEERVERASRLLKRKNSRTGTSRLRGKLQREKGLTLNGRS